MYKRQPLDRPGSLPKVIHVEKCNEILPHIENDIHSLLKQGFKSIALICKTAPQSKKVYNELKARVKQIRLLTGADRSFQTGIVVLPSYLAKGLEFDAVDVYKRQDYRYETFRLKTVLNEIEKQIKKGKDALELIKETQITAQKTAWDELPRFVTSFDDLVEISRCV